MTCHLSFTGFSVWSSFQLANCYTQVYILAKVVRKHFYSYPNLISQFSGTLIFPFCFPLPLPFVGLLSLSLVNVLPVAVVAFCCGFGVEELWVVPGIGMMWYCTSGCSDHFSMASSTGFFKPSTGFFKPSPCTCALVSSAMRNHSALSARNSWSWVTYLYPCGGSRCSRSNNRLAHFSMTKKEAIPAISYASARRCIAVRNFKSPVRKIGPTLVSW